MTYDTRAATEVTQPGYYDYLRNLPYCCGWHTPSIRRKIDERVIPVAPAPKISVLLQPWEYMDNDHDVFWTTRVFNVLLHVAKAADIVTVKDLCARVTECDLLKCRNFGWKSLVEVRNRLAKHGLQLGQDYILQDPDWYWGS